MNSQHSSQSNEHYTPAEIIRSVHSVLDNIELDPASCELANRVVRAKRIFTIEDNALEKEWKAKTVFLNPPGGKIKNKSSQALFWNKLVQEYCLDNIDSAIFLAFSLELIPKCLNVLHFPVCFVGKKSSTSSVSCVTGSGRIRFDTISENGERTSSSAPTHGNFIVLLPNGFEQIDRFRNTFSKYGFVVIGEDFRGETA